MKKQLVSAALAAVISAGLFSAPVQQYIGTSSVASAAEAVTAPKASRKNGTYSSSGSLTVKLTAEKGADIYYSTGGTYKLYTKPLKLTKNTTLKFYAQKNGAKSKTVTAKYKLTPKVTVTNAGGSYDSAPTVRLSSTASGVKFYYTLDGSKPTKSSAMYSTKGITVSKSAKLRVAAIKDGWSTKYLSEDYTIAAAQQSAAPLSSDSILEDYTHKYAYSTLSDSQKAAYARIYAAAESHAASADLSGLGLTDESLSDAYWAFDYDNPQFFWVGNGYSYTTIGYEVTELKIVYSRSAAEAAKIQPLFSAAAQKIIDKALQKDDLFERVLVIHDSITEMTTYNAYAPSYKSEADGPLVYGEALCEGYAKAFMYLCQSVGIECFCVAGYAGEDHMWNMLKLDGEWYHMDVTWDDVGTYEYFCVPDSQMFTDHTVRNFFPVPAATAADYSYSTRMGITTYTDVNSAYSGLVRQAAENYNNGVYETTIYVKDGLMKSLMAKINSQQFFKDLNSYGCNARGWRSSSTSKSLTITLS